MSFTQLTPHLWALQCRAMHYNTGVFISRGEAALIDPGLFPDEFDALRALLADHRAAPRWLILTHSHWDHVLGPERFPGVPVVAHQAYAALAAQDAGLVRWEIDRWEARHGLSRARPFEMPTAEVRMPAVGELPLGDLRLQLHHVPGHAADQLAVVEADQRAVWASDILSDTEVPYVSHNLRAYGLTLERLAGWDIGLLVPGHGAWTRDPAEIRARFQHDQDYLWDLGVRVDAAIRAGLSVEETVRACADMTFRRYPEVDFDHQLNVESVYLELGGRADPARVGWNKNWLEADRPWG